MLTKSQPNFKHYIKQIEDQAKSDFLIKKGVCQDSSVSFFLKRWIRAIKNSKYQLLKMTRPHYSVI